MATLEQILLEIRGVAKRMEDLEKSQRFLSDKYDDLTKLLKSHTEENQAQKEHIRENSGRIKHIEDRTRRLEQLQASNKVIISGVPESRNEKIELIVHELSKQSQIPLTINTNLRLGPPIRGKNRPILLSLSDETQARRLVQYSRQSRPTASSIHSTFSAEQRVYISTYLTPETKRLWDATYTRAKSKGYKFVWIRDGDILIRRSEREKVYKINTMEDAEAIDDES